MAQILKTANDIYVFDPGNSNLVLKSGGKFSSVFLGTRMSDKSTVVIKKLNNPHLYETSLRFQKEAVPGLNDGNVPSTLDAWKDESGYFIIKEFINGITLKALSRSVITGRQKFFCLCGIKILEVLESFHARGIIHCDLRPDNIMVANSLRGKPDWNNPHIYLLDFGQSIEAGSIMPNQRLPFALIYSPPEQVLNYTSLINATTDIYSLAVTLYECVTGDYPFKNLNPEMIMHLQLNTSLELHEALGNDMLEVLRKASFKSKFNLPPAQLDEIEIKKLLQEGINGRYQSANEFKNRLTEIMPFLNEKPKKNLIEKLFG